MDRVLRLLGKHGVVRRRGAEGEFEEIFNLSPDLIATIRFDGYYRRVNPSFVRTFGYSRQELMSRPYANLLHPDDLRTAQEEFADVIHGKELIEYENRCICADGSERVLQWNARAVPDEGVIYAIGRDVTDRRRAEREFEEMFDLSLDLLCITGVDGYFKRVNPAFEDAFGYSSQELLSRPFVDLVHPEDRARSLDAFAQLARGQEVVQFENRNVRADGSTLWLEWSSRPGPDGVIYGSGRDVTDRKRADAELRHAQQTVEASRATLAVHAEDQAALRRVATLVARGASPTEVFDAVAAEVSGLLHTDTTSLLRYEPDGAATVLAIRGEIGLRAPVGTRLTLEGESVVASVLRTGRPARMEEYADAPGSTAAHARAMGVRSAVGATISLEGRLWGGLFVGWTEREPPRADIEDRLASFAELAATAIANAESRAQLAASRARVVAATAEERRRVVRDLHDGAQQRLVHAVITLKLLLRKLGSGDKRAAELAGEALDHAERANFELRELVHGILPGALTSGGLRAGVDELASRASFPVSVDVSEVRLAPAVEATAYFVVSEALTNALKHSRAQRAQVEAHVDNGSLLVEVRDNGVGGADPGLGSGLTGLRDRVEALGGTIEITSPAGSGTSLVVEIPIDGS